MRTPIIAGNWKMNKLTADAVALAEGLNSALGEFSGAEVVVSPVATVTTSSLVLARVGRVKMTF